MIGEREKGKRREAEWKAVLSALAWQEGVLVSRHANRACSSDTAMLIARGITGRSIEKSASYKLPSYAMRGYSRTLHPSRTVPFCFLPMPVNLIACVAIPPATITSVTIYYLRC